LVGTKGIRKNSPAIVAPREEEGSTAAAPPERRGIGEHCGRTIGEKGKRRVPPSPFSLLRLAQRSMSPSAPRLAALLPAPSMFMKMWCERWASARSKMGRERGAPAKVGYMKSGRQ
jgi:hypothetical protein